MSRLIEDEFVSALLKKGYSLASRSDSEALFKEREFQESGLTDQNLARIGKLLNVPGVLVITLTDLETNQNRSNLSAYDSSYVSYTSRVGMSARLLSVEDGEILVLAKLNHNVTAENDREGTSAITFVARRLAGGFPAPLASGVDVK